MHIAHFLAPAMALIAVAALVLPAAVRAADAVPAAAPKPAACEGCGVVRSIRQVEKPIAPRRELLPDLAGSVDRTDSMNIGMQAAPLFTFGGGDSGVQRVERPPVTRSVWEIIIRYDDGQFGLVNAETEPMLQVGDRVRYYDRNLELLPKDAR